MCVFAFRTAQSVYAQVGFGMIIGGALGNVLDRMRDGMVTDFFQVGTFPIFNVADSCITIGVIVLLLEMVLFRSRTP
jgi:signal peptidase II